MVERVAMRPLMSIHSLRLVGLVRERHVYSRAVDARAAHYETEPGKFVLPYDEVRRSSAPDATLMRFLQSTCDTCSKLGGWDREALAFQRPA
jgi:uncharacterized protein DUF5996